MKRLTAAACGVLLLATWGLVMLHGASEMKRALTVDSTLKQLQTNLEGFRIDHGHYPAALSELLIGTWKGDIKELLQRMENNPWHDSFYYTPATNGFSIVVVGPDTSLLGFFGKKRRLEKYFEPQVPLDN